MVSVWYTVPVIVSRWSERDAEADDDREQTPATAAGPACVWKPGGLGAAFVSVSMIANSSEHADRADVHEDLRRGDERAAAMT